MPSDWQAVSGFPQRDSFSAPAIYLALQNGSEVDLVDINGTRRYYRFRLNAEIHIINNVFVFDAREIVEDAKIDESKQFPKKTRMDQ